MRKVILFMHMSLDGYVCGPANELDWATMNDEDMGKYLSHNFQSTVDTMLVGRHLFQGFEQYWPSVPADPKNPPELVDFANWMIDTPKIVFSNTLKELQWKNSTLAGTDPVTMVNKLKKESGGDMIIFGGAALAAYFAKHNLVDEYRLKLEPTLLGEGKTLFAGLTKRVSLKLIESRTFKSGVVTLYYQVIK